MTDEPEEKKPPTSEPPTAFSFKPVAKPLKEGSFSEGQTISVAPPESDLRLIAVIKNLSPEQISLEFPKPIPESPLSKGDKLQLKIWDYYEATYCESEVVEAPGVAGDHLVVSRPSEGETIERKRALATYDKIVFSLEVAEAAESQLAGRKVADLKAARLTVNGLEFTTELSLERGDKVKLNVQLPPDQEVVTSAEVTGSREVEEEESNLRSVEFRFIDMDAASYNRLALFLALTLPAGTVDDIFWTG